MKPTLFIIGGSSTALEIRETVNQFFLEKYSAVFNVVSDEYVSVDQTYIKDSYLSEKLLEQKEPHYILGFTNMALRMHFTYIFNISNGQLDNVIHPSSYISPSAQLGNGNYIAANAVVSSNSLIGDSNLVNFNVTIGHDVVIGSHCILNPGARVSGNVKIGNECLLGANSFIFQNLEIKECCQIDALCYIDRNIEKNSMCTNNNGGLKVYKRRW